MTQLQFSFVHLQEMSSSQEDSDQDLPPLTPVSATTSTMSFELNSAPTTLEQLSKTLSLTIDKNSEKSYANPPQESDPFTQQQESMAMTYMFEDGIVIHQDNQFKTYHDKSYIPTHMKDFCNNPTNYPYGWTQGIEEFCHNNNHHPNCKQPIRRAFIENEFIASIINNPETLHLLDNYLQTIYNNCFGRSLQWLHSSPAPAEDNHQECTQLTQLYTEVDKNQGCIYHTQQGL